MYIYKSKYMEKMHGVGHQSARRLPPVLGGVSRWGDSGERGVK